MISAHMYNLILTAEETQVNRNFRSVIILCGFAALIMLIVAAKLFYDRVIGPKIDEIESGAPKQKKKKNNNSNGKTNKVNKTNTNTNTNTKNNNIDESDDSEEEENTFAFEYASIEGDEEDAATEDIDTNDEGDAD